MFIELDGIPTLHDIVESQSVPVRVSLCRAVLSLVSSREMAEKLLKDGCVSCVFSNILLRLHFDLWGGYARNRAWYACNMSTLAGRRFTQQPIWLYEWNSYSKKICCMSVCVCAASPCMRRYTYTHVCG